MGETATRDYLIRRYFEELSNRHVFRDLESVKVEFDLPAATARRTLELYRTYGSKVEQYVIDSIVEPCATTTTTSSSLRQWAINFNSRQDRISEFYAGLLEDIDANVSSDLADQIRVGVESRAAAESLPVQHIGIDVDAAPAELLVAFHKSCDTADESAF